MLCRTLLFALEDLCSGKVMDALLCSVVMFLLAAVAARVLRPTSRAPLLVALEPVFFSVDLSLFWTSIEHVYSANGLTPLGNTMAPALVYTGF